MLSHSILIAVFAGLLSTSSGARPVDDPIPYNVVLIVVDDLGTDKLCFYNSALSSSCQAPADCSVTSFPCTPRLKQIKDEGIQFNRAYVNPVCSPSRAAMMTGRHGFRTGVRGYIQHCPPLRYTLPDSFDFIPEMLDLTQTFGVASYSSAAFGKWHLAETPTTACSTLSGDDCHSLRNGFSIFKGLRNNNDASHYEWTKMSPTMSGSTCSTNESTVSSSTTGIDTPWDASVNRYDAVQWINAQNDKFFAYVAFNPPHQAFQVPPHHLLAGSSLPTERLVDNTGSSTSRQYYELSIEALDQEIGALIDSLPEDTVVIIIGDNGTPNFAIDYNLLGYSTPYPFQGKGSLYDLGTRVPLLVWGPIVPTQYEGTECDGVVNAVDIWKTVGLLAGLSESQFDSAYGCIYPNCSSCSDCSDSQSFLHMIQNPASASNRQYAYCEVASENGLTLSTGATYRRSLVGPTNGVWYKYIRNVRNAPVNGSQEEFYDLTSDSKELSNMIITGMTTAERAIFLSMRAEVTTLSGS